MIAFDFPMPKGCIDCPFRHWVSDGDEYGDDGMYDICGLSGDDIPYYISTLNKEKTRMDNCKLMQAREIVTCKECKDRAVCEFYYGKNDDNWFCPQGRRT